MVVEKLKPTFSLEKNLVEKLKQLVPEAVADGKINWEILKEALGEHLEEEGAEVEHFGLNWVGKRQARRLASIPSKGTLVPVTREGIDEKNTENIFIEGDNLEVLKLLQKSYAGRVKMIYIDPPYNTGNDFIYKDNFSETITDYLRRTGQVDEEGNLLTSNPKSGGRYHSNWLNMMYPRLRLARNLLREDGVIFISIDDNEVVNLQKICDEIFGEENFFCKVIVRSNSRGQTYKQIAKTHEYVLIYTKNSETELLELEKEGDKNDLNLKDNIGNFNIRELRNRNPKFGKHNRPNLFYPIYINPTEEDTNGFYPVSLSKSSKYSTEVKPFNSEGNESCWRWGKDKVLSNISSDTMTSNLVAKRKQDNSLSIYEKYRKTTYKPKSIWDDNSYLNETGTVELRNLDLKGVFDFPKPLGLVKQCINLSCESDDIVLDFFSGSSVTAHAALAHNFEYSENIKFIMVQLPELCKDDSEAFKAGYKNIAEIGKERIRRVIKKIKEKQQNQLELNEKKKQDLGFKVFKLAKSNLKIWSNRNENDIKAIQQSFLNFENPLVEGWNEVDVVTEIQLLEGFPLDSKIEQVSYFSKNHLHQISSEYIGHKLFICLEENLNPETIKQVNSLVSEDIFICLDSALTDEAKLQLADNCNIKTI